MIQIREINVNDFVKIANWNEGSSKDDLYQWAGAGYDYPLSAKQFKERQDKGEVNAPGAKTSVYGIYNIQDNELVGTMELAVTDEINGTGSIGKFYISPENRGKGYGCQAVKEISREAFDYQGLIALFLKVFDFNETAIHCYEKCGFKKLKFEEKVYATEEGQWNRFYMMLDKETWLQGSK